ncbi:putative NADH dehydrogenase/NAD(P)H nitroreductase [Micromonospora humidisoli]|uniref:malonic semialdehyde reductase n=1 Tax=unclassified Micromonospora TaxID=2617518 RepID=UPI0022C1C1D5|nr:malonic semialdehyde reductase [Micromonospora sp. AKA109]GHJ07907.1 putative NADH dehydrogenase/NAD(P)H nitroreductase [Micromonospora sp. AKA109]
MTDVLPDHLITLDPQAQAQLFTEARTANTFTDTPVSDEQLRAIFDLAKYPPTAMNVQPLRVLFVRPGDGRDRLLTHVAEGNRAKTATAPVVAVLAADTDFHEHLDTVFPIRPGMREHFAADPATRDGMARFNAGLQVGYFLLAVRAAGLAAGPMGGFDATGVDNEFFTDTGWKSLLLVNIGHPGPDAWHPRLPRLDYDTVVRHA